MKDRKHLIKYIVLGVFLILALISGGVVARYQHVKDFEKSQILAEEFYFTTNMTSDSVMSSEEGLNRYDFLEQEESNFELFGGGAHEILFSVQNFYDDLRVSTRDIEYKVNITVKDQDGNEIKNQVIATVNNTEEGADNVLNLPQDGSLFATDLWKMSVVENSSALYSDGTQVIVTIESIEPYHKVIILNFTLFTTENYLSYEVIDAPNSPYAELIVRNGSKTKEKPRIKWPDSLEIDTTNVWVADGQPDDFKPMFGLEDRDMILSDSLKPNESISIYFFKTEDAEWNYSKKNIPAMKENGVYLINIGEPVTE